MCMGGEALTCHHMPVEVGGHFRGVRSLEFRDGTQVVRLGGKHQAVSPAWSLCLDPKFAGRIKDVNDGEERRALAHDSHTANIQ